MPGETNRGTGGARYCLRMVMLKGNCDCDVSTCGRDVRGWVHSRCLEGASGGSAALSLPHAFVKLILTEVLVVCAGLIPFSGHDGVGQNLGCQQKGKPARFVAVSLLWVVFYCSLSSTGIYVCTVDHDRELQTN